ncbi:MULTISPECIES: hypothetical protein [Rhodococcus]|uniref:Lipoprotein n=1 Tax=Rhodococcus opacus TaxID=37919 RepID=A0A076ESV5_RHOOP|nr:MULTISPECIES: hypothetical protein [Rhodococcus]AII08941.1 hypothetical protein EP51_31665 [Rhodococcus opacus]WAM13150.1 hypothetical protein OYT95_27465 [Rhodococcus sp. JS3073]
MNKKTTWILAPLAAVALSLSGCGDDSSDSAAPSTTSAAATSSGEAAPASNMMEKVPSPFVMTPQMEPTYVGSVDGSDAYVALARSGDEMIAFLCDGDQMWTWMTGTMDGDKASLSSPDGATLTASMSDGTVTGQVSAPGMPDKAFVAHPAGADEGMFRATTNRDGADYTLGWIMTADGVRGLERQANGSTAGGIAVDRNDDQMDDRQRERRQERREQLDCDEMNNYNTWLVSQPQTPPVAEMVSMNSVQMEGC